MTTLPRQIDDTLAAAVALARDGDEAAFGRIVRAYHDDMTRVCFTICGELDLADEAVAAAWAIAWRRLGSLRDPERLRPWLVSVAANEARQLLRRRRRRMVVEITVAPLEDETFADPAARAAEMDLARALARLAPEDRELLALRYVAGFDSNELARVTGRSSSGTRARLGRLLNRLRMELEDG
jgi:RNA polymerase sigma-70 factor (ECF subfamily)